MKCKTNSREMASTTTTTTTTRNSQLSLYTDRHKAPTIHFTRKKEEEIVFHLRNENFETCLEMNIRDIINDEHVFENRYWCLFPYPKKTFLSFFMDSLPPNPRIIKFLLDNGANSYRIHPMTIEELIHRKEYNVLFLFEPPLTTLSLAIQCDDLIIAEYHIKKDTPLFKCSQNSYFIESCQSIEMASLLLQNHFTINPDTLVINLIWNVPLLDWILDTVNDVHLRELNWIDAILQCRKVEQVRYVHSVLEIEHLLDNPKCAEMWNQLFDQCEEYVNRNSRFNFLVSHQIDVIKYLLENELISWNRGLNATTYTYDIIQTCVEQCYLFSMFGNVFMFTLI